MGSVAGLFLIGYGIFRFIVEYVREPEVEISLESLQEDKHFVYR